MYALFIDTFSRAAGSLCGISTSRNSWLCCARSALGFSRGRRCCQFRFRRQALNRPQRFLGTRPDAPGVSAMEPSHDPITIQQVLCRDRHIFPGHRSMGLANIKCVQKFALDIGKEFVACPQASLQSGILRRWIDADRDHLNPSVSKFRVILLQLTELHDAKRSPVALVEKHQDRPAGQQSRQCYRLVLRVRQSKIGKSIPHL